MTSWKPWGPALGFLLLAVGMAGLAAAEDKPKWEFEAAPYGWLSAINGSATVKGRTAQFNLSESQVWGLLEDGNAFAAAGYFSVRYDRWSAFVDSFGGYLEPSVSERIPTQLCTLSVEATAKTQIAITDFAVGYQLGRWALAGRRRPVTLGIYTGSRLGYLNVKLSASGGVVGGIQRAGSASSSFDWADPLIGVRWEVPLLDRLSLDFRGDIGGFGASSQLTWNIVSGVRFWLPWTPWSIQPWLGLGYRLLAYDRDFGSGDSLQLQIRGPTSGMGFVF